MGMLTEREIFDCLKTNLLGAADDCDLIAKYPASGPQFNRMRQRLKLSEGACRQAGYWRQDARWFPVGFKLEEAHQRARTWLHRPTVSSKKLFTMLAAVLRAMHADIVHMETAATGRVGMIVPKPQAHTRENRAVSMAGLILPPGVALPSQAAQ